MPTFDSLDPATGEVVATFPIDTADDVRAAVSRARAAARLVARDRFRRAPAAAARLAGCWWPGMAELADLVHRENGKPVDDAIGEIAVAMAHLAWAARHAEPGAAPPEGAARAAGDQPLGERGVPARTAWWA